ncbi:hypothetical protein GW17_00032409 [Ensete ventricosum]|nr:hypothetical protein GW17_00032409 [Ensete ventricosum]RZR77697.1 hypothetical protein BHM03_00002809 [Ensete ventricosum]
MVKVLVHTSPSAESQTADNNESCRVADSNNGSGVMSRTIVGSRQQRQTTAEAEKTQSATKEDLELAGETVADGGRGRNHQRGTQTEKSSATKTKREA